MWGSSCEVEVGSRWPEEAAGGHLHFRVAGESDESGHHPLSHQRLIHPLHQQLIGQHSRDVTAQGRVMDRASSVMATRREREEREKGKQKERKKVIYKRQEVAAAPR